MSFTNIGSLGNYMKTLNLQTQWQLKKKSGDMTSHKKSLEEWLDASKSALESMKETLAKNSANVDVQAIYTKIQNGKKLTSAEKEYLRTNDPAMYEKVKSIEMERKSYERDLKRCRTKDEVERVKMTRLGASLSTVKSISNNPNIPESAKLGNIMVEYAKMKAVAEVTVKFVQSGAYAKLPTDAEYAEAVKEMEQAKHPEQTDDREEQADSVEESEQNTENGTPTDTGTADISSGSRELPEDRIQRERINAKPDIEIESPEQRKVKQARAKAAYQHFDGDWEADVTANTAFFDTKG